MWAAHGDGGLEKSLLDHLGTMGEKNGGKRGKGGTAADRKAQLVARARGFEGPYGRQHFALRFIAHLAVLINGKPVHRA